jgi:hypothetical protein
MLLYKRSASFAALMGAGLNKLPPMLDATWLKYAPRERCKSRRSHGALA